MSFFSFYRTLTCTSFIITTLTWLSHTITTFLYVVVNHTQSGNNPTAVRDQQETQEMQALRTKFAYLPNLVPAAALNSGTTISFYRHGW